MFQHPERQGEVAIVLHGGQGTGKTFFCERLAHIVGKHNRHLTQPEQLVGRFNIQLLDCILLVAEEAVFAGNKKYVGPLKGLITDKNNTLEEKGFTPFAAPNYTHIIIASNDAHVVQISKDDRRFLALNVCDARMQDHAFFAAIQRELEDGGYEAMLHDMLAMDLTEFNVRNVPATAAHNDQKQLSLSREIQWWQDILLRGFVFQTQMSFDEFSVWMEEQPTELLWRSYLAFMGSDSYKFHRNTFGKFLVSELKLRPNHNVRNCSIGERYIVNSSGTKIPEREDREVTPGYVLGSLADARSHYCKVQNTQVEWPPIIDDKQERANRFARYLPKRE